MEAYTGFAKVYDIFMDETPYKEWRDYLIGVLKKYGISNGLVLDLGCGTGTLTELFAESGFDMIGVDISEEMLEIATEKRIQSKNEILYLCQDMREFELFGTVKAVICVCDSINYLTEKSDLITTFRLVNNYLDPNGLFIFDFNTVYKYKNVIGDTTIAENREDCSFIWENYYYPDERINEYDVTIFAKEGNSFQKFVENHYQKGYTLSEMKYAVKAAGLEFLCATDAETGGEVTRTSQRVFVVAREYQKEKK